jgi:tetratricopeptide (TPR) repeat protein
MHKGGMLLATAAILACTACLGDSGKLEIRSVESGLKAGHEPVPFRIAEARGHLALGNVALALEGFRKAAREDPASTEALAGMADCYDRMGRFDLSRRYFEQALALQPRNSRLLAAFAASFDRQGKPREAAAIREELAALAEPQAETAQAESPVPARLPDPVAPRMAEAAPPLAAPAPVGQSVTIALPPPRPVDAPKAAPRAPQAMAVAPVGQSVTIALPPPRPAPVAKPEVRSAASQASQKQPRVVRLSLHEVALFTTDAPRWKKPEPQIARMAAVKPGGLRILNAARVDRLAARTRAYLGDFGWRQVQIGDAAQTRSRSLILYPAGSRAEASRLSSRFGFAMAPRDNVRQLTILLGRDAAKLPALQRRS